MSRRGGAGLWTGTALIGLLGALALLSLLWTPHDPLLVDATLRLRGPEAAHWLGTDRLGRDLLSQLMVGTQTTLLIGLVSVLGAAVLGTPLGVLAALGPRWLDELVMRANDLLLAFPTLLLAIMFGAVFGADTATAVIAIGIATVPGFARIARAGAVQVRGAEFVLAARAAGRGRAGIAWRHVLPNIGGLVIVQASVSFAIAVLSEAALSYLGFGTRPPTPSWGRMLQEAQELLSVEPRLALAPGIAIAVTVLGFNLLGDGLRDRLDPRLAVHR